MKPLFVVAHVCTDSVNEGFLPAAEALGLPVVLLTDCAPMHREYFAQPGRCAGPEAIVACDVFNPLAIIEAVTRHGRAPAAIFSNSDHLQASTALAAAYFDLPGKDWRSSYRAKNKAEMRRHLAALGLDTLWHALVCSPAELAALTPTLRFPCVVKPREGVASQQVSLAHDTAELAARCDAVWTLQPGQALLLEEFIEGPLYTLETLGDGERLLPLGGFRTVLSPPPHFIELEAHWGSGLPAAVEAQVLDTIHRFGVGFGACHTEYVMTTRGPRLIEINYRNIGDYREFLLCDTLKIPLFEQVLRLYLGGPLPALAPVAHAASIRYFTAPRAGRLRQAPAAFTQQDAGLQLHYQPLRRIGEQLQISHSNKDYVGVLRGCAPTREQLDAAFARVSAELSWEIAP